MGYRPTIGLEVHAELKTRSKMFCDSRNDPDETNANVNVCPVCMAHPGTLPVINREAVRHILRIGSAIGGKRSDYSEFDRKSYFYPDIPKGYQISQYEFPLIRGGTLAGIQITRVHLEEDTARSVHSGGRSLVDFNRAGIPLMELVTEPVIHDAQTAGRFARELQLLLRTLQVGEANLEKGEMRIEANVSVADEESSVPGTKVEIKNLNSFRSVERAIAFEIDRQSSLLDKGESISQETRGWNESRQETFHQRFKEGSADYRYFPEPDLPKLFLEEVQELSKESIAASLPELPWMRRTRYRDLYDVSPEHIEIFLNDSKLCALFEKTVAVMPEYSKLISNYLCTDVQGILASFSAAHIDRLTPDGFAALIEAVRTNAISSRGAKESLTKVLSGGGDMLEVVQTYLQKSDRRELESIVETVINRETQAVAEYRGGKESTLQYLIGKAMQESKGTGNPNVLRTLFIERLS
jgi:aspartyl-tRNA(Asn)/glutamyl-tRNA(Gln) amidotransferase subunit B